MSLEIEIVAINLSEYRLIFDTDPFLSSAGTFLGGNKGLGGVVENGEEKNA